jgi:Ca2+:H+ antiporter
LLLALMNKRHSVTMMSTKNLIFFSLLIFLPVSIAAAWLGWGEIIIFITAALSILPLAGWIGEATEEIAVVLGPSWGGLLNATFGNATELIIALFALKAGLIDVVKASLTGSIISNLLLVMGLSMLLGGLKYKEQAFQPLIARVNASAMNLAVIAILLPTTVSLTAAASLDESVIHTLSNAVAVILMVVYGLSLVFSMKTHAYLLDVGQVEMGLSGDGQESEIANAAPSPTAPPATAAMVAQPDANPGDGDNPGKDPACPPRPSLVVLGRGVAGGDPGGGDRIRVAGR